MHLDRAKRLKTILRAAIFVLAALWAVCAPGTTVLAEDPVIVYFFWGEGCPHCADAKPVLADLALRYPRVEVRDYEVYRVPQNADLFRAMAAALGVDARYVPTFIVGDRHWVGYNSDVAREIESYVVSCLESGNCPDAGQGIIPPVVETSVPTVTPTARLPEATSTPTQTPVVPSPEETSVPTLAPVMPVLEGTSVPNETALVPLPEQTRVPTQTPVVPSPEETSVPTGTPPDAGEAVEPPPTDASRVVTLPLLGRVDLARHSLAISTALIAFVDGFNPCSLWVLSILIALTLHTGSRKKVFVIGLVFITVTAAVYMLFIAGLFTVFTFVRFFGWIQMVVALVALFFAAVNIKDYFWYQEGVSFTIADDKKPGIYQRARNILHASESFWPMVGATVVMAAGVSLVEFSCTAGFPVLWTNLLAAQGVSPATFAVLLALYMLIYQIDELAIFMFAVFSLKASRLEEKHGRILKLVGGTLMLTLAGVMIFNPNLMNDLASSLWIFGAAFAGAALVLLVHRVVLPRFGVHIGTEMASTRRPRRDTSS
jgi:cytochrome c biogenesis protein CcdA/thiol-disulfide isomerase/thioredoxin